MLCHAHPGAGYDEGSRRRDIECPGSVSASAAGIDDGPQVPIDFNAQRVLAHRRRESRNFVDGFTAHPQGRHECANLSWGDCACHDLMHRGRCLLYSQATAFDDSADGVLDFDAF
jgi:hypothetical protein